MNTHEACIAADISAAGGRGGGVAAALRDLWVAGVRERCAAEVVLSWLRGDPSPNSAGDGRFCLSPGRG